MDQGQGTNVTIILLLLVRLTDGDTFLLGYLAGGKYMTCLEKFSDRIISGNKARIGRHDYEAPGLRISGALTLAVEEANRGTLCCGHKYGYCCDS